jgi:hypothetical protein
MLEHVTDSRYIPLALLSGVGGRMQFVDLMNQSISLSGLDAVQTKVLLQTMRGQRLISGSFSSGSYVQLEQSGAELLVSLQKEAKERLQLAEKEAKQHAEEERQKKFSNVLAIAAIFEHLIVFILGVLVEHHTQLFAWIASLFH